MNTPILAPNAVNVNSESQEVMPRTLTIRRSQTARISAIFARVTGGQFHGCAGTQGRCTAEVARNIYATNLQAKLKQEPNGKYVIDLPYGWIYLSVAEVVA